MKRTCKKCGVEKDIERFVKNKNCKYGHSRMCNECKRKQDKQYREENKDYFKKYRGKNKDKKKIYLEKNKNRLRIYEADYRKKNKNICKARQDRWVKLNRNKLDINRAKQIKNLANWYIKKVIAQCFKIKRKDITPVMITMKRELIEYTRLIKELNNVINCR